MTHPDLPSEEEILRVHIQHLRELGYRVTPPPPPRPPRSCALCQHQEPEYQAEYMVELSVEIARGEEGHGLVQAYYCDDCLITVQERLAEAGVKNHRHGGIDFLEDADCPGYVKPSDCPTPTLEED